MLELDPVRLQDVFEGNIYSFINWQLKGNFAWDMLFKILLIFQFGVLGYERCKCGFFPLTQNMLLTSSALKSQLACPNSPPGVGVKLTAPPCCRGCRVNPRGRLNLEGQLSSPTTPSSYITSYPASSFSHLKRLQLRSTYTSPASLKKVQLSLLKTRLLVDASINPEGRVAVLQIPAASVCADDFKIGKERPNNSEASFPQRWVLIICVWCEIWKIQLKELCKGFINSAPATPIPDTVMF